MYSKKRKYHAETKAYPEVPLRTEKRQQQHSITKCGQQQEALVDIKCTETMSCAEAERDGNSDGNGNADGAETISRGQAEPHDERQDEDNKGKDRQQDTMGDAESATNERDPGTNEELEAMYELRLGEQEED
ncbi:MAG: hypothetical protein M1840_007525 [Geoglossum simile]|nr:MAG: hypothetical protein M1840_007525 [Geoglossum simile]